MKKIQRALVFVALWTLNTNVIGHDNMRPIELKTTQYEYELSRLLSSLNTITGVPGFSVSVVHKGKQVASVSTGYTDIKNNIFTTEESVFRLASVSKIVGASMLAELVIDHRLDADMPISTYLPNLDEKYQQITTRQLLSHTSGMPHYEAKDDDIYNKHYDSAIEALETLKGRSLLSKPGEKYIYSTHGYTLAGAVYEAITDKSLVLSIPDFIKRWTGRMTPKLEDIRDLNTSDSQLYAFSSHQVMPEDFGEKSYSIFGAGLAATSIDLAHLGYEVLKKSRNNKALEQLLFSPSVTNNGQIVRTPKYQVGFGWRIDNDMQGRKVYHHAGVTPGARSVVVIYPDEGLSIAILSNASWVSEIDKMAFSLASLYLDNAKALSIEPHIKYKATYGDSTGTGKVHCKRSICYIEDENTDYTKWLNQFNSTGNYIDDWPIFPYSSSTDERLLIITKTGIRTLYSSKGEYKASISKDKIYSLKIPL